MTQKPRLAVVPMYSIDAKMHLPADAGWREFARRKDVTIRAQKPVEFFAQIVQQFTEAMTENMGETDRNVLAFGLVLNFVQQLPTPLRHSFVEAVVNGAVLHTMLQGDQIIGDLVIEAEPLGEFVRGDMPLPEGPVVRPSGLVVP